MSYRRICDNEADSLDGSKRYVDETENTIFLSHSIMRRSFQIQIINMEQELEEKKISETVLGYWFLCLL